MKIKINESQCVGCGLCNNYCPEVFSFDKDKQISVANNDKITKTNENDAQIAILACPIDAIAEAEEV